MTNVNIKYTYSRESFSSSSLRLGSLCRPKVILRASTCSFSGLYSSCRRRVVSSSLFRSFSDCLMVLSICKDRVRCLRNTPCMVRMKYLWLPRYILSLFIKFCQSNIATSFFFFIRLALFPLCVALTTLISAWMSRSSSTCAIFSCRRRSISCLYSFRCFSSDSRASNSIFRRDLIFCIWIVLFLQPVAQRGDSSCHIILPHTC